MKVLNIVFGTIVFFVAGNFLLTLIRGSVYVIDYEGVLRWMYVFKFFTYIVIITLLYSLWKTKRALNRERYFSVNVARYMQWVCVSAFVATVFNALANAAMQTWHDSKADIMLIESSRFRLYVMEQFFDVSLLIYVLIVCLFLVSRYIQKAIDMKAENEMFI